MKNCLKIPRILIPEEEFDKWSVVAADAFAPDSGYWQSVESLVGEAPSTLRFILPEIYAEADGSEQIESIRAAMFRALEQGDLCKLSRGFTLVERTTKFGIRRGIVAAIDLEEYNMNGGAVTPICSATEIPRGSLNELVALRKRAPLEFPHAIVLYKDKKRKVEKLLRGEDLEALYECDLMQDGGHIKGWFIPEELAFDLAEAMQSRVEPCFAVAEGARSVAAAKLYWEELKGSLSERERCMHPARYALAELVNLYDDAVVLSPVHRIVTDCEPEVLCDYFMRNLKCRRAGNLLYPAAFKGGETVKQCDAILAEYVKQNGGKIGYVRDTDALKKQVGDDAVGIVMQPIEKDDFFDWFKGGRQYPQKTFTICDACDKRYYMEGREISYD